MWKRILLLLMCIVLPFTWAQAEENDRWIKSAVSRDYDHILKDYLDTETIITQNSGNEIIFWVKNKTFDYWSGIKKISVNRSRKTYRVLYCKRNDYKGNVNFDGVPKDNALYIRPDSTVEQSANVALERLGLPPIYGTKTHNWKKFYESNPTAEDYEKYPKFWNREHPEFYRSEYYICTDTYNYKKSKGLYLIYVRRDSYCFIRHEVYLIDMKNQIVYCNDKKKFIVPESFEEALYNEVKKMLRTK